MPCNFCELSSTRYGYGCRSQEQDSDAELLKEVERLRLLIKRMTGKEDSMTFTELEGLESQLKDVQLIVRDLKKKIKLEEDETQLQQNKEAEDHGTKRRVLAPCRPEKQDGGTSLLKMKRAFDRRNAESLQSEFDRLWLLNERMNGRELHGMTSFELLYLDLQISRAMLALSYQMTGPRKEVIVTQPEKFVSHDNKEPISRLDSDKDDGTSLQHRQLFVSRKLRRLQNR